MGGGGWGGRGGFGAGWPAVGGFRPPPWSSLPPTRLDVDAPPLAGRAALSARGAPHRAGRQYCRGRGGDRTPGWFGCADRGHVALLVLGTRGARAASAARHCAGGGGDVGCRVGRHHALHQRTASHGLSRARSIRALERRVLAA